MSEFRFLHTSDLHLGRRFGNLPEEVRARLISARSDVFRTLADAARQNCAEHVLIAGDIFDTETPSDQVVRHALNAMGAEAALSWWIIPGNHDSLSAEELWGRFRRDAPPNVRLLDIAEPVEITPGVTLLPSPAPSRFPGRDLTEWMTEAGTPGSHIRLGLAHGGVQTFGSEDGETDIIPPDRAEKSGLTYLALGDWHGRLRVNERTYYSGSPERDRFKHAGRGLCLSVTIPGPGAVPSVSEVETGRFDWSEREVSLTPELDLAGALQLQLPSVSDRREDILLRLRATGWVTLEQRLEVEQAIRAIAPDFCHFEFDDRRLATEYRADDLDAIDVGGALRLAADTLRDEAKNTDLSEVDRRVAEAALNRLYTIVRGDV